MRLKLGKFDFSEVWDGVYYKTLADYPRVGTNEMRDILDFIAYEKANGRSVSIEADRQEIMDTVERELCFPERYRHIARPPVIRECRACKARGGCMTDLVCHTAPLENAEKILRCGSLLSAVNARGLPASLLRREPRNAANDPEDFFHYVMFAWGNCQAGDRLVMERKLGRSPLEWELGPGFTPGIRFFFLYDKLEQHPNAIHDGVLPVKVKDEVKLEEYVHSIIIPSDYRERLAPLVPSELEMRVHYLSHSELDIWQWAEMAYACAAGLDGFFK